MKRHALLWIALCLFFCPDAGVAGAGRTGLSFLKLGVGARAAGFGDAYTAIVDDATAVYWNPAAMTAVAGADAAFIHTRWFQDISHEFLGAVVSNGVSAVGFGFTLMSVDGIERRTDIPTEQPLGTFDAHDLAVSGSYARVIRETVSVGVTVKAVSEKILFDTASGVAFDIGVRYRTPYEGVTVGGALKNVGPELSFVREAFDLPRAVRIGVGYVPAYAPLQRRVLLSADIGKFRHEPVRLNLGGEYAYADRVSVTAGYQTRHDEAGFSAGFGVRHRQFRLHYAFAPFGAGLGTAHRFALGVRF